MTKLHDETRQFIRDLTKRSEVFMAGLSREMSCAFDNLEAKSTANLRRFEDLHDKSVAQRDAFIHELRERGIGGTG